MRMFEGTQRREMEVAVPCEIRKAPPYLRVCRAAVEQMGDPPAQRHSRSKRRRF